MLFRSDQRRDEEAIVAIKPGFGAPAAEAEPRRVAAARYRPPPAAVVAVGLVALAGIVFFGLPRWVEPEAPAEAEAPVVEAPAAEPAAPARSAEELAALQARAESMLTELLQQRSRLEARSAPRWGGAEWVAYDIHALCRSAPDSPATRWAARKLRQVLIPASS